MSGFGNVPPFYVPTGIPPVTNTRTTNFTGAGPWTFTANDAASAAETIATFGIAGATGVFSIANSSTTDGTCNVMMTGLNASNGIALAIRGLVTTDNSSNPAIVLDGRTAAAGALSSNRILHIRNNNTTVIDVRASGKTVFTPIAASGSGTGSYSWTAAADTNRTLSTEVVDWSFGQPSSIQWATGALATQRNVVFEAPSYRFAAASVLTNAATVAIAGPPVASTNATITNSHAFWVQAGNTQLDGATTFGLRANLKSYTVATLPAAGVAGGLIYVSNETGGAVPAFSDATDWRRVTDRAIVA